jgi:hypothetical protein
MVQLPIYMQTVIELLQYVRSPFDIVRSAVHRKVSGYKSNYSVQKAFLIKLALKYKREVYRHGLTILEKRKYVIFLKLKCFSYMVRIPRRGRGRIAPLVLKFGNRLRFLLTLTQWALNPRVKRHLYTITRRMGGPLIVSRFWGQEKNVFRSRYLSSGPTSP